MEEKDVFLCSAVYNEDDMKFRRNVRGGKVKHTYIHTWWNGQTTVVHNILQIFWYKILTSTCCFAINIISVIDIVGVNGITGIVGSHSLGLYKP